MKPPILKKSYFDELVDLVQPYFNNLNLNFDGFDKLVDLYSNLTSNDYKKSWELSRDFNMWGDYFSNLKAITEKMYLDSETEKKKIFSAVSINKDVAKVANGDRLANREEEVISIRKKRNALKAFSLAMDSKIEFCYRTHHHCKATWCNYIKLSESREKYVKDDILTEV